MKEIEQDQGKYPDSIGLQEVGNFNVELRPRFNLPIATDSQVHVGPANKNVIRGVATYADPNTTTVFGPVDNRTEIVTTIHDIVFDGKKGIKKHAITKALSSTCKAKEKAANNSKQSERDASKQENRVQSSRKGSFEDSEAPKLSGRTNSGSFDRMQKNGSLDSPRDRSGSCGSSVSSNGSSTSSAKSSASSNGSSKKVVVVRSAPITIGKVQLFINNTQAT